MFIILFIAVVLALLCRLHFRAIHHQNKKLAEALAQDIVIHAQENIPALFQELHPHWKPGHHWPLLRSSLVEVFISSRDLKKGRPVRYLTTERYHRLVTVCQKNNIADDLLCVLGNWQVHCIHHKDGSIIPVVECPLGSPRQLHVIHRLSFLILLTGKPRHQHHCTAKA